MAGGRVEGAKLRIDGFGGDLDVRGVEVLAADLTELGLPAESVGMFRRSEPGSEAWIALIASAHDWLRFLGELGGAALAVERVGALSARLRAAVGRQDRCVASVRIPFPWDEGGIYGVQAEVSLVPGEEVDAWEMWRARVVGVERAMAELGELGHRPLGWFDCRMTPGGFTLRWANVRAMEHHEADFDTAGNRRGAVRDGWTDPS